MATSIYFGLESKQIMFTKSCDLHVSAANKYSQSYHLPSRIGKCYTATIVYVERLVGPKAPGETCHIVIDHGGNVPYLERQSYGVIPSMRKFMQPRLTEVPKPSHKGIGVTTLQIKEKERCSYPQSSRS